MKHLTKKEQRDTYRAYKELRIGNAYNLMVLLKTGKENSIESQKLITEAKDDILDFSLVFEESIVEEVRAELGKIG